MSVIGLKCECCRGKEFILDRNGGGLICSGCGYVIPAKNIEEGPEWRSFEGDDGSRIRVGMPPTLMMQDKGLSTLIGLEGQDSIRGNAGDWKRLRKWQRRISTHTSNGRNLSYALSELNKLGEKLGVPYHVLNRASYIYRMALERKLVRGRAIKYMVVGALYVALRYEGITKTKKELSRASGLEAKELARHYRLLLKALRIKMPVADPVRHVRKICACGGIAKEVALRAEKIVRLAQRQRLTIGKDPVGVASAAVYYACVLMGVEKSQRNIAVAANITEVTVRNRYKSFSDQLNLSKSPSL